MRRILLSMLVLLVTLVALTAGLAWYATHNEAFLKSQVEAFVLRKTGRELRIDGALRLALGRETTVEAEGIHFANASWADTSDMARIDRLRVDLDLPSLFNDAVVIPLLELEGCSLDLVKRDKGPANWDILPASAEEEEAPNNGQLPVVLLDAEIRNCRMSHTSPSRERPLLLEIDELSQQLEQGQHWQIRGAGRIDGEPIALDGWVSPARALVLGGPIDHELKADIGKVELRSAGTLQNAATGEGANIELSFKGPEFGRILNFVGAPGVSSGPFDFRLSLDTENQMTRLNIRGDLGTIRMDVEGTMDRLVDPTQGRLQGTIEGPNLELLAAAFGLDDLPTSPYALDADLGFEPGLVRFNLFELDVLPADRLSVLGKLYTGTALAGTDLDIGASTEELGRWTKALGRPDKTVGAVMLTGRFLSDASGAGSVRARIQHLATTLTMDGSLGNLSQPLQPDIGFDLHSDDPRPVAALIGDLTLPQVPVTIRGRIGRPADTLNLQDIDMLLGGHAARLTGELNPVEPFVGSDIQLQFKSPNAQDLGQLFGLEGLPLAAFELSGRVSRPAQGIRFQDVALELDGHHLTAAGLFNPAGTHEGSEFDVQVESTDVGALGQLFGQEGLPSEPLSLAASLQPEGKGLRFETRQAELGAIRLSAEGRIADLARPSGIDARFDVRLPSMRLLQFLVGDTELPDLPFSARGTLHNEQERVRLEDFRWTLGDTSGSIDGDWYTDQRVEVSIEVSGSDASQLQSWFGTSLEAQPFAVRTQVSGDAEITKFTDLTAEYGASRAGGDLTVALTEPVRISGKIHAPLIDLSGLREEEEGQVEPRADSPDSPYVFVDKPLRRIDDYGVDLDLDFTAELVDLGNTTARDVVLGIRFGKNRLELEPFMVSGAGSGKLKGHAIFDDSGDKPALDAELFAENLRLGLAAGPNQDISTYPPIDITLSLQGQGFTQREMASSLDGKLRVYLGPGQVASAGIDLFFSDFLTELFEALNPLAESSEYTRVDCAAMGADIEDGVVRVDPAVFHTEAFTIFNSGTVNLGSEKIDLSFTTKPRKGLGITPGTVINTLIKVGGTLKKPAVELDPQGAIVAGTAAIATAGLSIVAKGFSDRFLASKDPCGDARKELEKRDP